MRAMTGKTGITGKTGMLLTRVLTELWLFGWTIYFTYMTLTTYNVAAIIGLIMVVGAYIYCVLFVWGKRGKIRPTRVRR